MANDIEFESDEDKISERSDTYLSRMLFGRGKPSFMVLLLKKSKLAKTDIQAYYILTIIAVLLFVLAIATGVYIVMQSRQSKNVPENVSPWLQEYIHNKK